MTHGNGQRQIAIGQEEQVTTKALKGHGDF